MLFLLVDLIRVHRLLPSPLHRDGPGDWQRRAGVPLDEVAQLRASAADKAAADKAAADKDGSQPSASFANSGWVTESGCFFFFAGTG